MQRGGCPSQSVAALTRSLDQDGNNNPHHREFKILVPQLENLLQNSTPRKEFYDAFGPRRLVLLLAQMDKRNLRDASEAAARVADLAEAILDDSASATTGFSQRANFGDEIHREELYPDVYVQLRRPLETFNAAKIGRRGEDNYNKMGSHSETGNHSEMGYHCETGKHGDNLSDKLAIRRFDLSLAFDPRTCQIVDAGDSPMIVEGKGEISIRLRSLSRRHRIGGEIECKIWPAAHILARFMWLHPWLIQGAHVLELGSGVGLAGIAASACGAHSVLITDIHSKALATARENCLLNGPHIAASTLVAKLDWSNLPHGDCDHGVVWSADAPLEQHLADEKLTQRYDVIIAADVVNADGLPELLVATVERYLSSNGLFLMCAPRPQHRHRVEELRGLLLGHAGLEVRVCSVPASLCAGVDETDIILHELYLAQWAPSGETRTEK